MTIHELSVQAQRDELVAIIGKLSASLATVRDAFSHNRELPVDHLHQQLGNLIEEIAFTSVRADEHQPGEPLRNRRPSLRYQSILSHLHILASVVSGLIDHLQKQLEKRISLYEQAIDQTDILFAQQEMILCTLAEAVRTGDQGHLRAICTSCNELIRLCQRADVVHEKCVVQGHCNPDTALQFLKFLDLMRSFVHHERETVRLLVRWMGRRDVRSSR
jgi:Na+/phosphate symporter